MRGSHVSVSCPPVERRLPARSTRCACSAQPQLTPFQEGLWHGKYEKVVYAYGSLSICVAVESGPTEHVSDAETPGKQSLVCERGGPERHRYFFFEKLFL